MHNIKWSGVYAHCALWAVYILHVLMQSDEAACDKKNVMPFT